MTLLKFERLGGLAGWFALAFISGMLWGDCHGRVHAQALQETPNSQDEYETPNLAFVRFQGPALFWGPGDPLPVRSPFTVAIDNAAWAHDHEVIVDGVATAVGTLPVIDDTLYGRVIRATDLALPPGPHLVAISNAVGPVRKVSAIWAFLVVADEAPAGPSAPTNLHLRGEL